MIRFLSRFDWLGHIVEAVAIGAVVVLLLAIQEPMRVALIGGIMFAVGHFHGREKRDYEVSVDMPAPHLKGYLIWRWSWDQLTDFLPVFAVGAVAYILSYVT